MGAGLFASRMTRLSLAGRPAEPYALPMIFDFETDFSGTLTCIPMIVRFKLDLTGVKLSLRQWSRFSLDDRQELVHRPCVTASGIVTWRNFLVRLIEIRAGEDAKFLPIEASPPWEDVSQAPGRLVQFAGLVGAQAPDPAAWASMDALRRFTLYKLSAPGHDNDNFVPAMREFGLIG